MIYSDPIKKINRCMSKEDLALVLRDSLNHTIAYQVAGRCGIKVNDFDDPEVVYNQIASEFLKNPKARQLVSFYLNESNRDYVEEIRFLPALDMENTLLQRKDEMAADKETGRYLWGLVVDQRSESEVAIMKLVSRKEKSFEDIQKVLKELENFSKLTRQSGMNANAARDLKRKMELIRKMSNGRKPGISKKPKSIYKPLPSREKLQKDNDKLKKDLKELKESNEKLLSKNEVFSEKLKQYQDDNKKYLTELQDIKRDKNLLDKEMTELADEMEKQKVKIEQVDELSHKAHHLERENRKLEYRVEKLGDLDTSYEELVSDNEKLVNQVDQLKKNLNRMEQGFIAKEKELENLQKLYEKKNAKSSDIKVIKRTPRKTKPKVGIFVDVQNMFYGAKEKYGAKLDYQKLFNEALRERTLFKAVCYVVRSQEIKKADFVSFLKQVGYEVKIKDLKTRMDGSQKGDWDLGMAIDIIMALDKMDVIVLVSGDGDFYDLIKLVHNRFKKRVEVFSFPHNTAVEIEESADAYFPIDERFLMN